MKNLGWLALGVVGLGLGLGGCGGGSGGSRGSGGSPTGSFTLSALLAEPLVFANGTDGLRLQVNAAGGLQAPVQVTFPNLPSGLTISPNAVTLGNSQAVEVMLSADTGAPAGQVNITVAANSPDWSQTFTLPVQIAVPGRLSTRTRYVFTGAATQYDTLLNPSWMIYEAGSGRLFLSDPASNRVLVLDASTEKLAATLTIPGAWGMDDSPDHSTIWIGTRGGDVYTVDANALTVTHRYPGSSIGPKGFRAISAQVLADGRVALLGPQGGIPTADGETEYGIWDPTTNDFTLFTTASLPFSGAQQVCSQYGFNMGAFRRTNDRTGLFITSIDGGGLCAVDAGGNGSLSSLATPVYQFAVSPDGRWLASRARDGGLGLFDAHTLALVGEIKGNFSTGTGLEFSTDSATLYEASGAGGTSAIAAYAVPSLIQTGWMPSANVWWAVGGSVAGPGILVLGNTGLIAEPRQEGINFVDTSTTIAGPTGTTFLNDPLTPSHGPISGSTAVQWNANGIVQTYFGGVEGEPLGPSIYTPPGQAGTVDVYGVAGDGGTEILPFGFSYGPSLRTAEPNYATTAGGGIGEVFGYGLGPVTGESSTSLGAISITVGGTAATVLNYDSDPYESLHAPFPLQGLKFQIPAHATGTADIVVTTGDGSATLAGAIHYLPAAELFPAPGAVLEQGIYDPKRDLYYFTDSRSIRVFSRTLGGWQAAIPVPNSQRLWGIALSPSSDILALSDSGANVIYTLDPDNPTAITTHALPGPTVPGTTTAPAGVAVSDAGMVYYTTVVQGGTGFSNYFKLDTTSGAIHDYQVRGPGLGVHDNQLRALISADGGSVYFNNDGQLFRVDTRNDTVGYALTDVGCCYGSSDLALAPGQDRIEASGGIFDAQLFPTTYFGLDFSQSFGASWINGAKFSADGSLMFQPDPAGIDVMDGFGGEMLARVGLPFALAATYDALVADGHENVLLAITGTGDGLALLDLTSIPEPAAPPPSTEPWPQLGRRRIGQQLPAPRLLVKPRAGDARSVPH